MLEEGPQIIAVAPGRHQRHFAARQLQDHEGIAGYDDAASGDDDVAAEGTVGKMRVGDGPQLKDVDFFKPAEQ